MNKIVKRQLINIVSLALSAILFSASFPGLISKEGIAILSFIALIPMFFIVYRLNNIEAVIYGFIFGMGKYLLFNYWLKEFDPAAYAVAPGIYGLYFLMLFPLIRLFYIKFPKHGYLPILVAWLSYEFFKSTNVVGYSYGVLSQSMYRTHLFTGIADIVGSYLLSALIIFPGIFLSFKISKRSSLKSKSSIITITTYLFVLLLSIIYTQLSKVDYSESDTKKISLVQHNLNCWLSGSDELYSQAYDHLKELSIEGENQGAELVIWSESSFVPAIEWHKKYRSSIYRNRVDLINEMEEYLRSSNAYYIIGTNESADKEKKINYNPAYLYKGDKIISKYRKINLVPFTEQFPFPDKLPWLLDYVNKLGAKQMQPGEEQTLFEIDGLKTVILICYEDAFTDLPREGVKKGSDLLINITNDAWTSSPSAALQHLAAAALRTIENRRTLVRSATTGFTGIIDPNGKIIASLPLFTRDQLTYDVPIYNGHTTIYTLYGHIIDLIPYLLLLPILLFIIIKTIYAKRKSNK